MKDANGFDELARQKLAERDHAFDPAHWADMERLLAERERKPKAWWPWMAAGLLLIGGGAIWAGMADEPAPSNATRILANGKTGTNASTVPTAAKDARTEVPTPVASSSSDAHGTTPNAQTIIQRASSTSTVQNSTTDPSERSAAAVPSAQRPRNGLRQVDRPADRAVNAPAIPTAVVLTAEPDTAGPETDASGPLDPAISLNTHRGNTPDPAVHDEPGGDDPGTDASVAERMQESLTNAPSHASDTARATASPLAEPAPFEPEIPAPSAWLTARHPFELTLLGGAFSTASNYSGSATETWGATTERQNAPGFGLEISQQLSDHFSFGIGAHYTRYRERLMAQELTRTDEWISSHYILVPHDTLVLQVTGIVTIGGIDYYVTELVPMTINEVALDVDTTYTTTIVRERRNVTNTVSYVEVPMFIDAHTTTGRWVLGVRGGPTFGFLTGRQGSLPQGDDGAYADLREQTFSALTVGCTARAYARYRVNGALAVGVEPAWRKQLGNAFGDGSLERRSAAFGAYLSVSYRFGGGMEP